jgi:hypothetical protein
MVSVKISGSGSGVCALSARDGDGLTVAFENDQPLFLSWKSFKQLLSLRLGAHGKAPLATKSAVPGSEGK